MKVLSIISAMLDSCFVWITHPCHYPTTNFFLPIDVLTGAYN